MKNCNICAVKFGGTKIILMLVIASLLGVLLTACGNNPIYPNLPSESDKGEVEKATAFPADYTYPENPAEDLRKALISDIKERSLPMEISDIQRVAFDGDERSEMSVDFMDSGNTCVIFFNIKSIDYDFDYSFDGKDNPSFTLAFRDNENTQDMILLMSSVIRYLSPNLSSEEAIELSKAQDETLSIDGYSQPQDVGWYQVQSRQTNPNVFVRTNGFDAMLGVKVTALKQIWGEIKAVNCEPLNTKQDYNILLTNSLMGEDTDRGLCVYGDFIVKNVWQHQEPIHGDMWEIIDVVSETGGVYSLRYETMFGVAYEFGVGQKYTIYIKPYRLYGATISYAIQRDRTKKPMSRGDYQPMDYLNPDLDNPVVRIEPDAKGKIYNVWFELNVGTIDIEYAALEGQGIGEKQWPHEPSRSEYEFDGWFDNLEWKGVPYNADTPIYQDTTLYAKWKYIGAGGTWPRNHRGDIRGINDGDVFSVGQPIIITSAGYNLFLKFTDDQRYRWFPISYRVTDVVSEDFPSYSPYTVEFYLQKTGKYTLYVTYKEEIFDGRDWQNTGQVHEVEERTFWIK